MRTIHRAKSIGLVTVQLASIACLLLSGPLVAMHPLWGSLEFVGLVLGVWSLATMPLRQLRVTPEVAPNAKLVASGPYRFIRHPMYLSVLVTTISLVIHHFTAWRLAVWCVLLVALILKIQFEEMLLRERFPEYREYQRRTKRLIPFLY